MNEIELLIKLLEDYLGIAKDIRDKRDSIDEVLVKSKQDDLIITNVSHIYTGLKKLNRYFENLRMLSMWVRKK